MRVLWLCNVVLNDFAEEFKIRRKPFGGWMEGLLHCLRDIPELEIGVCFPVYDEDRMRNGVHLGHRYYSFQGRMDRERYAETMSDEFCCIIQDFQPDIVYIWGTEYNHSYALMEACCKMGLQERVIVHVQGLVSICARHYVLGIPYGCLKEESGELNGIMEGKHHFEKQGKIENSLLAKAKFIVGRTEWDRICIREANPHAMYLPCDELLREGFYRMDSWVLDKCTRYRIFLSQASYPVKGAHFAFRALPWILEEFPDAEVYIGGADPTLPDRNGRISDYGRLLLDEMEQLGIRGHVHFLGLLSTMEMIDEYLKAHIFISPSTIENSSNSICEAMMLGVPVVASYVGGTPSLVSHGKDGYLYPCDAPYMMAGYVQQIFGSDDLVEKISKEARRTAKKRHSAQKVIERALEIYHLVDVQAQHSGGIL